MACLYGVFLVYPKSGASWSCFRASAGVLALGAGGMVPQLQSHLGCCAGPAGPAELTGRPMWPVVEAVGAGASVAGEVVLDLHATVVGSSAHRGSSGESRC